MVFVTNRPFFLFFFFQDLQARKISFIPQEDVFTIFQKQEKLFQAIKTKVQKVQILRFFQRSQSMVLVENWPFFHFIILGVVGQENVFYDILKQKKPFQTLKTKRFKPGRVEIFPKGLDHGFRQKQAIFPFFLFQDLQARKMSFIPQENVFTIFQKQKKLFQALKTKVQKVVKLTFLQRGQSKVLVENWPFFLHFIILGLVGQENVFYDILKRRKTFLGFKNEQF